MTDLSDLRQTADQRRMAFFRTSRALADRARPLRLLDDAVGAMDPAFNVLSRASARARENPVAVVAALALVWLFTSTRRALEPPQQIRRSNRLPTTTTTKGDDHGYFHTPGHE